MPLRIGKKPWRPKAPKQPRQPKGWSKAFLREMAKSGIYDYKGVHFNTKGAIDHENTPVKALDQHGLLVTKKKEKKQKQKRDERFNKEFLAELAKSGIYDFEGVKFDDQGNIDHSNTPREILEKHGLFGRKPTKRKAPKPPKIKAPRVPKARRSKKRKGEMSREESLQRLAASKNVIPNRFGPEF